MLREHALGRVEELHARDFGAAAPPAFPPNRPVLATCFSSNRPVLAALRALFAASA
jgi:hypothetical protein